MKKKNLKKGKQLSETVLKIYIIIMWITMCFLFVNRTFLRPIGLLTNIAIFLLSFILNKYKDGWGVLGAIVSALGIIAYILVHIFM